jgi:hypothetical protein
LSDSFGKTSIGKQFHWKKPECCPEKHTAMGAILWMKRYRCPDCHAVHTCRPEQFLPGMQYPVQTQKSSLEAKLAGKPFLQAVPRQIPALVEGISHSLPGATVTH